MSTLAKKYGILVAVDGSPPSPTRPCPGQLMKPPCATPKSRSCTSLLR